MLVFLIVLIDQLFSRTVGAACREACSHYFLFNDEQGQKKDDSKHGRRKAKNAKKKKKLQQLPQLEYINYQRLGAAQHTKRN